MASCVPRSFLISMTPLAGATMRGSSYPRPKDVCANIILTHTQYAGSTGSSWIGGLCDISFTDRNPPHKMIGVDSARLFMYCHYEW